MQKLTEVLNMGGYGDFVWPAYAIAASIMAGMVFFSVRSLRKAQASLAALQAPPEADEA